MSLKSLFFIFGYYFSLTYFTFPERCFINQHSLYLYYITYNKPKQDKIIQSLFIVKNFKNRTSKNNEVAKLNEKNAEIKEQTALNKELLEENKKLRNLLKTSLYPEIANELLKEEGLLKSDQQLVTKKYLSENIITSDSKISFEKHTSKRKILEIKDLLDNKTKY